MVAALVRKAVQIPEKDFETQVITLARLKGWKVAKFRPARTLKGWRTAISADGQGWPDLFMVRGGRCIAGEIKVNTSASAEQLDWIQRLHAGGIETFVWKPCDWTRIKDILE